MAALAACGGSGGTAAGKPSGPIKMAFVPYVNAAELTRRPAGVSSRNVAPVY